MADVAAALGIGQGAKVALHRVRRHLKARVATSVLARRQGGRCPELAALPAKHLLAITPHLDACDSCTEAARAELV